MLIYFDIVGNCSLISGILDVLGVGSDADLIVTMLMLCLENSADIYCTFACVPVWNVILHTLLRMVLLFMHIHA
jgi:hypothetical protein